MKRLCAALACLATAAFGREGAAWTAARSAHFDVYTNAGSEAARSLAGGLERLHSFFVVQTGLAPRREIRVIAFATPQEYARYRTRATADAFYLGAEERDYIVLPAPARGELRVPAHEYAHVLMHSGGWKLPEWIAEGVSDVISTVRLGERESRIGGDLAGRSAALRNARWMPLAELFVCRPDDPVRGQLFYAESWAVADLLMLSPEYGARFPALLAALVSGVGAERAIHDVYGRSSAAVERDARARVARGTAPVPLAAVPGAGAEVRLEALTEFAARAVLADLRMANGDAAQAEALYRELLRERPTDAGIHAALGRLAAGRGDNAGAAAAWKRAVELGIADAALCYRYGVLAGDRAAIERAIALRPDFDDARFQLALLEKNAGHAEAAIAQLRAMRQVAPARAFAWWSALADALLGLERREEAREAAAQARTHASNDEERGHAAQLKWLAETELAVEIDGERLRQVRVPVGATRNPFIEAGDHAQRAEGELRDVECDGKTIRVLVETAHGALALRVPDPSRVEIRNAGGTAFEFTCGAQEPRKVLVEYAGASLVLRGLELR